MPKEKKLYKGIAKAYRHQTIDNWLFSYVIALTKCDEKLSLRDKLLMFAKDFDLSDDDYPLESMLQKWYKMSQDYLKLDK